MSRSRCKSLSGANSARLKLSSEPWYAPPPRLCFIAWPSLYAYYYDPNAKQATQITTGTSELRDITKMERIGTSQPPPAYAYIRTHTLVQQVRTRTSAALVSMTG